MSKSVCCSVTPTALVDPPDATLLVRQLPQGLAQASILLFLKWLLHCLQVMAIQSATESQLRNLHLGIKAAAIVR